MFFTRTNKYQAPIQKEDLRSRLVGNHLTIHDLDFEVYARGQKIRIVPHAENVEDLKTLPITDIDLKEHGNTTEVVVTSKIRKLDLGGPQLILSFCGFLVLASMALLLVGRERMEIYTLLGICSVTFTIFWVRMEIGYFDYVRKIREYVRSRMEPA